MVRKIDKTPALIEKWLRNKEYWSLRPSSFCGSPLSACLFLQVPQRLPDYRILVKHIAGT